MRPTTYTFAGGAIGMMALNGFKDLHDLAIRDMGAPIIWMIENLGYHSVHVLHVIGLLLAVFFVAYGKVEERKSFGTDQDSPVLGANQG